MYSYIKGELAEILTADQIVVEANQIGYHIRIPSQAFDALPKIGADVKIYTYLHVKEDAHTLYGFLTRDDLEIFRMLITVSGIGPKGALAILSVMSADDFRFAVLGDDAKAIAKAPGVGAKTAQRVIMELKDKLNLEDAFEQKLSSAAPAKSIANTVKGEAVEALVSLGYTSQEAVKVLNGVEVTEESQVEDLLKEALKAMAFL